jgi:hypothetical protein
MRCGKDFYISKKLLVKTTCKEKLSSLFLELNAILFPQFNFNKERFHGSAILNLIIVFSMR